MIAKPYPQVLDVFISDALGKTLAKDILATEDVPNKSEATMDGYAVRISDLGDSPTLLEVFDELSYGSESFRPPHKAAVRVRNGGEIPKGTDTVVRIEETNLRGNEIIIKGPVKAGDYVREKGSEARAGQTILSRGTRIDFPLVGILGILGKDRVPVYNCLFNGCYYETPSCARVHHLASTWGKGESFFELSRDTRKAVAPNAPRVAIFSTGNEIVPLGRKKMTGQVYEKNSYVLGAMIEEEGGIPVYGGILPDDTETISAACMDALTDTDYVFISGGTSIGRADKINSVFDHLKKHFGFTVKNSTTIPEREQYGYLGRKGIWALPGRIVRAIQILAIEVLPMLNNLSEGKQPCFNPLRLLKAKLVESEFWDGQNSSPFVKIIQKSGAENIAIPLPFYREFTCLLNMNAMVLSPKNGKGLVPGKEIFAYRLF